MDSNKTFFTGRPVESVREPGRIAVSLGLLPVMRLEVAIFLWSPFDVEQEMPVV
jgi:hypothetical protein